MKKLTKLCILWSLMTSVLLHTLYIPAVNAEESSQTLTILFTHDLHDNFLPVESVQNGDKQYAGGYARLYSAIQTVRAQEQNVLLVDAGDYSMGTPFQTIFQTDSPELRLMGQMGYDVVTLGNHEFDYRAEGLADSLQAAVNSGEPLPQMVQSNITFPVDHDGNLTDSLEHLKQSMEDYGVKEYTLIERNGIKVGIFGVMGADSASKAPMSEVQFEDEVIHAKRVVDILKQEGADIILCLSHSGTWPDTSKSEDEILAKKVPDMDVIISGHTHSTLEQPIMAGDTIIASGGCYGENLGRIDISKQDNVWTLLNYELQPINETIPEDKYINQQIQNYKTVVEDKYFSLFWKTYDEVIARSPFSFPRLEDMYPVHNESTLGNLISDGFIYTVKEAEGEAYEPIAVAIVPIGTIRGSIPEGDITTAEAFSISSLGIGADKLPGYPLISAYLTGKELKTLCEVDASVAPLMDDAQLYMSGMNFTFNPNRLIFNKVTDTSLVNEQGDLEEINDKKLYRIVAGLYSAQMLSVVGEKSFGLLSIVPKTKEGTPITDFEKYILHDGDGNEIKEWYALAHYLQSFEKVDGVSVIPEYYNHTQGRKVVDDNGNIFAILSNPNHISLVVYGVVLVAAGFVTFIVVKIVKRRRKKSFDFLD
ncbi:bifunctional metallophosphatase/5'-nucleotidase [Anaerocolumna aminovalerica]|uniref:bifunctional metallophosphatase/5'-nucleotidase n=2 Tax=Anaerocolumna aminovalerica TaxID=1527 RepID=UPI000BE2C458|nr:bifunctional UDP-sugar hydrolase/5'-nucleotidase [Anaerocolumna aminovalerica]